MYFLIGNYLENRGVGTLSFLSPTLNYVKCLVSYSTIKRNIFAITSYFKDSLFLAEVNRSVQLQDFTALYLVCVVSL